MATAFVEGHRVRKTGERPRNWREVARVLGLAYPRDGKEPTVVKGGLCDRWASKAVGDVGGHDVHEIIKEAIEDGIPGMATKNEEASDNRGRKMGDALGSLFKWAMRYRRSAMKANPVIGSFRPGPPPPRDRVLSDDEIASLWSACDGVVEPFGRIVRLLLLTGCRLNEIAKLEWRELNEDFSTITLPGRRTKNSLPHVVSLPPMAREIVEGAKRVEDCPYVFTITGKTPPSGWSKVKTRLDEAMVEAAKKEKTTLAPWRLHDLRRTAATGMAELGIAPHIVEAALNHVSGARAGVAGTYNRALYVEEKKAALERWAAHVEGIVSGKPAKVVGIETARKRMPK